MSNHEGSSLARWLDEARALELSTSTDANTAANANMLWLTLAPTFTQESLEAALRAVVLEYQRKALAAGKRGHFYAWVDEMAGQLRCGFAEVDDPTRLPFRCKLRLTDSVADIVDAARAITSMGTIPWDQLVPSDADALADGANDDSTLLVLVLRTTPASPRPSR